VLNNIRLGGYVNPYLYILFILMLPFETPVWLVLLLSFIMGLCIDMFLNTMGMHAFATVLMGYCRSHLLRLLAPREGYEFGKAPSLFYLGYGWYFSYAGIMVALHHFTFFYIEVFRFTEFFYTFFRFLASSLFTMFLITLSQYLMYKSKER
jgi:rod shape-determining protein MreD